MATEVQDDYLDCGAYQANTGNKSAANPGFITFEESNGDHFFAWVNGDEIVMRSEAYPDADKRDRGIKAILKNCDLPERYAVTQEDGKCLLLMYGGGDHQAHTGNRENHSEIGRSCPHNTREALNALLHFKGRDFADKVVPIERAATSVAAPLAAVAAVAAAPIAAAIHETKKETAAPVAAASSYVEEIAAAGGGLGWLKWLLPILLLGALLWWWKGCKNDGAAAAVDTKKDTVVAVVTPPVQKVTVDTVTGVVNYDLGAVGDLTLCDGSKLTGIPKDAFESNLVNFINTGTIDTVDKKANWFTMHDVQFITGKTEYATDKARTQIKNIGAILKSCPKVILKLGGYTDFRGDEKMNKDLSERRAKQVAKDLIAGGALASQIKEAVGYGSDYAVTKDKADAIGLAKDRKTSAKVSAK